MIGVPAGLLATEAQRLLATRWHSRKCGCDTAIISEDGMSIALCALDDNRGDDYVTLSSPPTRWATRDIVEALDWAAGQ